LIYYSKESGNVTTPSISSRSADYYAAIWRVQMKCLKERRRNLELCALFLWPLLERRDSFKFAVSRRKES